MPRRNKRPVYTPADVTELEQAARQSRSFVRPRDEPRRGDEPDWERRLRIESQRNARINRAIDWSGCIVPGCGESLIGYFRRPIHQPDRRDSTLELPICYTHAAVVWNGLLDHQTKDPKFAEAIADVHERVAERKTNERAAAKTQHMANTNGHIYFVRLNGLIKVGWSRDVDARLRAYGPDVEILCIFPGTREDETNLHRQFRPVLARGREWYQDHAILTDYATRMVTEHGEPKAWTGWTKPKETIRPRKRAR